MAKAKKSKPKKRSAVKFVTVSSRSYGNALKGLRIYYEGKKPKNLRLDGTIQFGKHILESLTRKFREKKFHWIITLEVDSITTVRGIIRVRTSLNTLRRMGQSFWDRSADLKNDTVSNFFATVYPTHYVKRAAPAYVPGTLSGMLTDTPVSRLSTEDRDAINKFLPAFLAAESLTAVNLMKATAQITSLKELAAELEKSLDGTSYSESRWQTYIQKNILIIQQGYIAAIEKMNIAIGNTKYPDFMLVTHDNYLDILEIKKPNTPLLKEDPSRKIFFWDPEIAKALIQVENYIEYVSQQASTIRNYIRDTHAIDLQVVRPRGIILAGDARKFVSQKQRDDYRLLCSSTKNVAFVTYDELLNRLKNYIRVLEEHTKE